MKIKYQEAQKKRLDVFLNENLPDITRSQIKKFILAGAVKVNGEDTSVHRWLKSGDEILFDAKIEIRKEETPLEEPIIIEENKNFIVVNKPSGLLVHATDKGEKNTLAEWLVSRHPVAAKIGDDPTRPGIVHRLDKEVSGLMVMALTQDYFDLLKKAFQDRTIQKEYIALVHGQVINDQGDISKPLERDKKTGLMRVQSAKNSGKHAYTVYEVVQRFTNYTLVKIQIKTGRTHQIRAHFYSIGHSIVGDKLYQTKDLRKKSKTLKMNILLQANHLAWKDGEESYDYKLDLPKDFSEFIKDLK